MKICLNIRNYVIIMEKLKTVVVEPLKFYYFIWDSLKTREELKNFSKLLIIGHLNLITSWDLIYLLQWKKIQEILYLIIKQKAWIIHLNLMLPQTMWTNLKTSNPLMKSKKTKRIKIIKKINSIQIILKIRRTKLTKIIR